MKAPDFWYNDNFVSSLLAPLAKIYTKLGRDHYRRSAPQKLDIPVICVGNIVSGGSGKTPTAIALINLIQSAKIGLSPFFLTRGYRGKVEGPERVDDSHDPALWGDEALLLARHAPTIVSKHRYKGGVLAQELGADMIIMDDGMQNYTLQKNLTFCIIDGGMGFGNGKVLPQGPLRQPLEDGFALCDAFIIIGEDKSNTSPLLPTGKPVFKASLQTRKDQGLLKDKNYVAFCGIGYPEKFASSLKAADLNVVEFRSFADHHDYSIKELEDLVATARAKHARLITTLKDHARLPEFSGKYMIDVLNVEIIFDDDTSLTDFIKSKVAP